jgi:uncharacterized protein (UPF0261 family)
MPVMIVSMANRAMTRFLAALATIHSMVAMATIGSTVITATFPATIPNSTISTVAEALILLFWVVPVASTTTRPVTAML